MAGQELNLQEFGLTSYESGVYLALVDQLSLSIKEIVEMAKIPRTQSYETLKTLILKGWITKKGGRPTHYIADDPAIIFQGVRKTFESHVNETLSLLESKWEMRGLMQTEPMAVITGSEYIRNETIGEIRRARKSVFMVIRFLIPEEIDELLISFKTAKRNGIQLKILLSPDAYNILSDQEKDILKSLGVVKLGPVPVRALMVDQKRVLLSFVPIVLDEMKYENSQTIIISYENFAGMMQQSLNVSWEGFELV